MGIYRWTLNQYVTFYKRSGNLKRCPKQHTLRENILKIKALEYVGKQYTLDMLFNSRKKAIEGFRAALKNNKEVYNERLEKEKDRLKKQVLKDKKLEQKASNNINSFDM